jgi:hypothetical protein
VTHEVFALMASHNLPPAVRGSGLLLVVTSSYDATADFLLSRLPADGVFRLNTDLFQEYQLWFDAAGFTLTDPTGRRCSSAQVYKAYWRWPDWPAVQGADARYAQAERRYLLSEITNLLWLQGKFVLVEPGAPRRSGKLIQLTMAARYFDVPAFRAGLNTSYPDGEATQVVKSLSKNLPDGTFLFSTAVDSRQLDPEQPWFMQSYVDAAFDVTVVAVRDRLFAFKLPRDFLASGIDWRAVPDTEDGWSVTELAPPVADAIRRYMRAMRLDFGRLDFLLDSAGELHFCEVNPNPQYAWLDYEGEYGLTAAVLDEISPATERHPIPAVHPLAEVRR